MLRNLRVQQSFGGMRDGHKIEAGCGIREMLKAGYGMKISWRDRDVLTLIGAGCGIVLNFIAGCGIKTTSDLFEI